MPRTVIAALFQSLDGIASMRKLFDMIWAQT